MFKKKGPLAAYSGVQERDKKVLQALLAHGADLSAPRRVLHFVFVDTEATSHELASSLTDWQGKASPPVAGYDGWTVIFERHEYTLTPENVAADALLFEQLAKGVSGKYDGWEASV